MIQTIAIWALPVLLAITLHEAAHAWVAHKLGDNTAKSLGRVSINPFKHIDPIGTVVIPLALFLLHSPFLFGWAKPVPINWRNLKHVRRDTALVSIAGPLANFLMAIGWFILLQISYNGQTDHSFLVEASKAGITINLLLMALNLLPILPLDGGRVLHSLLPGKIAYYFGRTEPYGFVILILLLATGSLSLILSPFFYFLRNIVLSLSVV